MIILPPFHGVLAPVAGGPFDPASLNPTVWLDSSDQARVFTAVTGGSLPADGGSIGRIESKEGSLYSFSQATTANRPLRRAASVNGLDMAEFDGSNDFIQLSATSVFSSADAFTLFFVARHNWTGLLKSTFGIGSNTSISSPRFYLTWTAANRMLISSRRVDSDTTATFSPINTFPSGYFLTRVAIDYQAQTISAAVNGTSWGSQSSFGTAGATDSTSSFIVRVGGYNGSVLPQMDFGVLFAFRRILSGTEIANLESYLMTRYGIT